jgi:hypothetical protein
MEIKLKISLPTGISWFARNQILPANLKAMPAQEANLSYYEHIFN